MASLDGGARVAVSLLPSDCKEEEIRTVFSTYGEVLSIQMHPPGADGLRSAVVVYDSEEAAEDAEEVLDDQYSIRRDVNRPIRVRRQVPPPASTVAAGPASEAPPAAASAAGREKSPEAAAWRDEQQAPAGWPVEDATQKFWTDNGAQEAHKLWVGSLPPDITQEELRVVFGTYGQVLKVHIMPTLHRKGKSAFVLYASREAAEDAIEVLDEAYRIRPNSPWPMQVRRANPTAPPARGSGWSGAGGGDGEWRDSWWGGWSGGDDWWGGWEGAPQESSWSGAGCKGGGKRRKLERPCPNCSCMVTFELPEEWFNGSKGGDRSSPQHVPPRQDEAGGQAREGGKGNSGAGAAPAADPAAAPAAAAAPAREEKPGRVHVFANLPASIDEQGLKWVFAQYGEVTGVQIEKDEANPSRAQAFVDFKDPYDAETSVMTLDGQYEIRSGFGPIRLKATGARPQPAPY